MRSLAQEFRSANVHPERRLVIAKQMSTFRSRVHLVAWAERVLYAAVGCFIVVAMVISLTAWRKTLENGDAAAVRPGDKLDICSNNMPAARITAGKSYDCS
jgi:hypothetical protein